MKQAIQKLTHHTIIYGLGHILTRSIGFLLLPIHTNYLAADIYGNAALLFASLAILNIIFTYGMDTAFLRYFVLSDSKDEKRIVFSTAFWMILCTSILFGSIMLLLPDYFSQWIFRSNEYRELIYIAAGIVFTDALALMPFLILRAQEKSLKFAIIKFINVVLNFGLNFLFIVHWDMGIKGIFMANLFASSVTLIILIPTIIPWLRWRFQGETLKFLLQFGLPYIPSGLAVIIMDQIGRFFLDRMVGKEATGLFSANYKLGMIMAFVIAAFRFAWHPFFLATSKQKDAPRIFGRVFTYFFLITAFIFLIISLFIKEIVQIHVFGIELFGKDYASGISIVPVVLLAYISYGIYVNFMVGIYVKKKTHYLPFVTGVGALMAIGLNTVLIPQIGIYGAAWASFGAYTTMALCLGIVSRRLYPIPYEWRLVKIILVSSIIFIISQYTPSFIHRILLLSSFPFLLTGMRFFLKREIEIVMSTVRHLFA